MSPMDYISYSQYSTYSCPRSWYLSRVVKAEERQSWYLPIGTAVHQMIEDWDEHNRFRFASTHAPDWWPEATAYLYPLIEAQRAIEPNVDEWMASGPKDDPFVREKAVQLVRDCFEKAVEELDQIDVWEIEYDASGNLPGLEVPVKGYIDLIGEHKKQGPVIIDWKTGSTKPGNFQLETYGALMKVPALSGNDHPFTEHGSLPFKGRYVMLAPGTPNTRYVDLSTVDPAEVGAKYQEVYERMKGKHYEANAGFGCKFCLQQDNCLVNAGMTKRALYYDRSRDDGYPY